MLRRQRILIAAALLLLNFTIIELSLCLLAKPLQAYSVIYGYSKRPVPVRAHDVVWCKGLRFKPLGPVVALVSYPGSGNTWLRYLLQQVTGVMTGSLYYDPELLPVFPAEGISNGTVLVVKTHKLPLSEEFQAAVLLIRQPKDAILAELNRMFSQKHLGLAPINWLRRSNTSDYITNEISAWLLLHETWLALFPGRILVVLYETLVRDTGPSLQRIADFLNHTVTKDDMSCALAYREGLYRRRKKDKVYDPFTAEMYQSFNRVQKLVYTLVEDYEHNLKDKP